MNAQMVKLVDTPASGAGDLTVVEVRVFFWAPIQTQGYDVEFPKTRESGFLRFWLPEILNALLDIRLHCVGAAEGCDLLILL